MPPRGSDGSFFTTPRYSAQQVGPVGQHELRAVFREPVKENGPSKALVFLEQVEVLKGI